MKVFWSNEALNDIERIYQFYSLYNIQSPMNLYNSFLNKADLLADHPFLRAIQDQIENPITFRSLVVASGMYKIIYFINEDAGDIVISQVFDCRQHPDKIRKN